MCMRIIVGRFCLTFMKNGWQSAMSSLQHMHCSEYAHPSANNTFSAASLNPCICNKYTCAHDAQEQHLHVSRLQYLHRSISIYLRGARKLACSWNMLNRVVPTSTTKKDDQDTWSPRRAGGIFLPRFAGCVVVFACAVHPFL